MRTAVKAAYNKFATEHIGGYVPIWKVRRELGWTREDLDAAPLDLNHRAEPAIELHGGNPMAFTESQRADSLKRGSDLYLRMRWRRGH
ncbi:hypothetical protein ACFL2Q_02365 [Thermodesulfobacteriota bacterium]